MRKLAVAALIATAAIALACSTPAKDVAGPGAQGSAPAASGPKHTIKLEVSGPATADITFALTGDTSQEVGAKLPWTKELTSNADFLLPSIVAQSKGTGEIVCRITVDGKVTKENKSSGQFAVVTCTGS